MVSSLQISRKICVCIWFFIILWRAALKPEYLSQSGRPLLDNGSVTTFPVRQTCSCCKTYIIDRCHGNKSSGSCPMLTTCICGIEPSGPAAIVLASSVLTIMRAESRALWSSSCGFHSDALQSGTGLLCSLCFLFLDCFLMGLCTLLRSIGICLPVYMTSYSRNENVST
jgi:hypothetical protein